MGRILGEDGLSLWLLPFEVRLDVGGASELSTDWPVDMLFYIFRYRKTVGGGSATTVVEERT